MNDGRLFISQDYGQDVYKHKKYPIYITQEFDFFRCVEFNESFYGVLAIDFFENNLRFSNGRYSKLFPNQKLSYWADSADTARAEIKRHGSSNNIVTFWAYDDCSSTIPCMTNSLPLKILDGRGNYIQDIFDKISNDEKLTKKEETEIRNILNEKFDAVAYFSHAFPGGENFIFFESGFRKLALRQIRLRFGRKDGGSHCRIVCADGCDYDPYPKAYGECFAPKARIIFNEKFLKDKRYLDMEKNAHQSFIKKFCK